MMKKLKLAPRPRVLKPHGQGGFAHAHLAHTSTCWAYNIAVPSDQADKSTRGKGGAAWAEALLLSLVANCRGRALIMTTYVNK